MHLTDWIIRSTLVSVILAALLSSGHGIGFLVLNALVLSVITSKALWRVAILAIVVTFADTTYRSIPDTILYSVGVLTVIIFARLFDPLESNSNNGNSSRPQRLKQLIDTRFLGIALCILVLVDRAAPIINTITWAAICFVITPRIDTSVRRRNWSSLSINSTVLVISCIFAIAICELGARLILPDLPSAHADYLIGDRELRFRNAPGVEVTVPLEHYGTAYDDPDRKESFKIKISSQGFRSSEIGPKSDGEFRILMLGDSFTFGYGVENDETISKVLENKLRDAMPGRHVTVINAGVVGYGPWQELLLLKQSGFELKPDLVIMQTFTNNDIADSLSKTRTVLKAYIPQIIQRELALEYQSYWHVRLQRWLRVNSAFYQHLVVATGRENLLSAILERIRGVSKQPIFAPPPSDLRNPELETELREYYPQIELGWSLFRQDVGSIHASCRERNVRFMAYCIPGMHMIYDPYWTLYCEPAGTTEIYERGKTLRLMEETFEQSHISFVRTFDTLSSVPDPLSIYFQFNKHLTRKGCEIVATQLCSRILNEHISPQ
jgi:hypothetical protein